MRIIVVLIGMLMLSACGGELPQNVSCSAMSVGPDALARVASRARQTTEAEAVTGMAEAFANREAQRGARVDVLLLSSGGQWGAFSAGFLNGWSENIAEPRPNRFEAVTGVSTGALQAPFAFAGKAYDDRLTRLYRGVSERQVLRRRGGIELIRAPSIWDPSPLEASVRRELTPELIDLIAREAEARSLLVGAVNLQSGFFQAFDLTAMAQSRAPQTADCLREGLMASAAIPIAFPPRQIDGALHVDGAARQGLFLQSLAKTDLEPTVYILVNNAVSFPSETPEATIPGLVGRTQSIVSDELLRQSAIEAVQFAKAQGWQVRGAVAPDLWPGVDCVRPDGQQMAFCPSFTRDLYDRGFAMASQGKIKWLGADALIREMRRRNAAQLERIN